MDALANDAALVQKELERLGRVATAITKAFQLVGCYEKSAGSLLMNSTTRNRFSREPKADLELDYAMFAIQQGLIDRAYTPENLKKHRGVFDGAKFETSTYFPGKVEPPGNPNEVSAVRINASQPTVWGAPVSGWDNLVRRPIAFSGRIAASTGWLLLWSTSRKSNLALFRTETETKREGAKSRGYAD